MHDFIIFHPESKQVTLVTTENAAMNVSNALRTSSAEEVFIYKLHCIVDRAPSPQQELPL